MADEKKVTDYLFPGPRAALTATKRDVDQALAAGQIARALGAATVQGPVRMVGGIMDDTLINPGKELLGGIARFAGGALGTSGPGQVAAPVAAPKAAPPVATPKVAAAAAKAMTPQERQLAFLDKLFTGPLSLEMAQAGTAMLPKPAKAATAKDTVLGETAKLSAQMAQMQIDAIMKSDLTDAEKRTEAAKAMENKFARDAGLVGFNPVNLATAMTMSGAADEEE